MPTGGAGRGCGRRCGHRPPHFPRHRAQREVLGIRVARVRVGVTETTLLHAALGGHGEALSVGALELAPRGVAELLDREDLVWEARELDLSPHLRHDRRRVDKHVPPLVLRAAGLGHEVVLVPRCAGIAVLRPDCGRRADRPRRHARHETEHFQQSRDSVGVAFFGVRANNNASRQRGHSPSSFVRGSRCRCRLIGGLGCLFHKLVKKVTPLPRLHTRRNRTANKAALLHVALTGKDYVGYLFPTPLELRVAKRTTRTNSGGKMVAPATEVVVVLNKPTAGTKLARWPGPAALQSRCSRLMLCLSCAGLHH